MQLQSATSELVVSAFGIDGLRVQLLLMRIYHSDPSTSNCQVRNPLVRGTPCKWTTETRVPDVWTLQTPNIISGNHIPQLRSLLGCRIQGSTACSGSTYTTSKTLGLNAQTLLSTRVETPLVAVGPWILAKSLALDHATVLTIALDSV